jgi:hypothetical protein
MQTAITMASKPENLWYFAYGSNMSAAKFTGSRGIIPLDSVVVLIPGWILTMEIPGMPYSEPAFSSITACGPTSVETGQCPDVIGIAYLITQEQHVKIIASEGGGIAYSDICLTGEPIHQSEKARVGVKIVVRTLGTAMGRRPPPAPSRRYMVRLEYDRAAVADATCRIYSKTAEKNCSFRKDTRIIWDRYRYTYHQSPRARSWVRASSTLSGAQCSMSWRCSPREVYKRMEMCQEL